MNRLAWLRRAALAATMLVAAGCSFPFERPPQPALHDFGPIPETRMAPVGWSAVTVDAPEWLQDARIRYRLRYADPTQVRFYALARWVAPPSELLGQRLKAGLGTGGRFNLAIELQEFEQVFDSPGKAYVVMRFRATVRGPGHNYPMGEKAFRLARISPSTDSVGAVEGLSLLVNEARDRLSDWVAQLPAS